MSNLRLLKNLLLARLALFITNQILSTTVLDGNRPSSFWITQFPKTNQKIFNSLYSWIFYDGHFYLEIARHGHTYESIFAFFPGFPKVLALWLALFDRILFFSDWVRQDANVVILLVFLLNLVLSWISLILLRSYMRLVFEFGRKLKRSGKRYVGIGYQIFDKLESLETSESIMVLLIEIKKYFLRSLVVKKILIYMIFILKLNCIF